MRRCLIALIVLLIPWPALAQTNITVLGTGKLAFDFISTTLQPVTLAEVQAYTIRVYVPATAPAASAIVAPQTCTAATTAGTFNCTVPLSAITTLSSSFQSLALTSGIVAADGTAESVKVTAPFQLRRVGPPVSPAPGMSILP